MNVTIIFKWRSYWVMVQFVMIKIKVMDKWKNDFANIRNQNSAHGYNVEGPVVPWPHGSWIYNYLCNQCLSPLMLWVRISIRAKCTTLCDNVCQWLATDRWFSTGPAVSSTNKTDLYDITNILLKVALNTIKQTDIWCWKFK